MKVIVIKGFIKENSYILKTKEGDIVVDVGWPSTAKKILKRYKNISLIVLTHRHYDHHGSVEFIKSKTDCKIAAYKYLPDKSGEIPLHSLKFYLRMVYLWCRQGFKIPGPNNWKIKLKFTNEDITLKDNDVIPGTEDWKVVYTPGHTTDSICLYNEKTESLISGDIIVNNFGKPHWGGIITDKKALEYSKQKLSKLEIKKIYPGHGDPFDFDLKTKDILFNEIFCD